MALKETLFHILLNLLVIQSSFVFSEDVFHPTAQVWSLTPHIISQEGGVVTIYGKDFAADTFTFNDPNIGNKVLILSFLSYKVRKNIDDCD